MTPAEAIEDLRLQHPKYDRVNAINRWDAWCGRCMVEWPCTPAIVLNHLEVTQEKIIEALCGQALADHLGDVRNSESDLWKALGVPELPYGHPAWDTDSAWRVTKARLTEAGLSLPDHLQGSDDEVDDGD